MNAYQALYDLYQSVGKKLPWTERELIEGALKGKSRLAPQDLALEAARREAMKPEYGALGELNTSMERAKAAGMNVNLYHGTSAGDDFDKFGTPDAYMTANRRQASGWAENASLGGEGTNPRVMPLLTNATPGRSKDIAQYINDAIEGSGDIAEGVDKGISQAMNERKRYVTFTHPNVYGEGEHKVVASIFPRSGDIRSRFAAFNPALKDSGNLLAGLGAAGVGIGAAMAPGESEAGTYAALAELQKSARDAQRTHTNLPTAQGLETLKELANPFNLLPLTATARELGRPEDLQFINGQWMTLRQALEYYHALQNP